MNWNDLIASGDGADISNLNLKFTQLKECMIECQNARSVLEEANRNLCESYDFNKGSAEWNNMPYGVEPIGRDCIHELIKERDHRRILLYAARIRLYTILDRLKMCREEMLLECEKYQGEVETKSTTTKNPHIEEIGRINYFFCNQLAFNAYKLCYELKKLIPPGEFVSHYWTNGHKVDLSATLASTLNESQRVWAVKYSLYSKLRFDGPDPDRPPPGPLLTLDEAKYDAFNWVRICDGDAIPVNMRTGEFVGNIREQR